MEEIKNKKKIEKELKKFLILFLKDLKKIKIEFEDDNLFKIELYFNDGLLIKFAEEIKFFKIYGGIEEFVKFKIKQTISDTYYSIFLDDTYLKKFNNVKNIRFDFDEFTKISFQKAKTLGYKVDKYYLTQENEDIVVYMEGEKTKVKGKLSAELFFMLKPNEEQAVKLMKFEK